MHKDAKFLNEILGNQVQQYVKRIDTISKWDLSQSYKAGSTLEKSSNIIYHINIHRKNIEQNLTPIHDKNSQQNMNRDKGP